MLSNFNMLTANTGTDEILDKYLEIKESNFQQIGLLLINSALFNYHCRETVVAVDIRRRKKGLSTD